MNKSECCLKAALKVYQ